MFKILLACLVVFTVSEAARFGCKSDVNPSIGDVCAAEQRVTQNGCCDAADVYDIDTYACRSDALPSIGGYCPDGFFLVADDGCCDQADAFIKSK